MRQIKRIIAIFITIIMTLGIIPTGVFAQQIESKNSSDSKATAQATGKDYTSALNKRFAVSDSSAAVIKNDGTLWSWGTSDSKAVGVSSGTSKTTPHQILDHVSQVGLGMEHGIALKDDGTVWTWGHNNYGQLGDGTLKDSAVPKQVFQSTNIKEVDALFNASYIIFNDGTELEIGGNFECESNNVEPKGNTFQNVIDSGQTFKKDLRFLAGWDCSLEDSGKVVNQYGELMMSPVKMLVPSYGSGAINLALGADNTLYGWCAGNRTSGVTPTPAKIISNVLNFSEGFDSAFNSGGLVVTGNNDLYKFELSVKENTKYQYTTNVDINKIQENVAIAKCGHMGEGIGAYIDLDGNIYTFSIDNPDAKKITDIGEGGLDKTPSQDSPDNPSEEDPKPSTPNKPSSSTNKENELISKYVRSHLNYINSKDYQNEITSGFSGALAEAAQTIRDDNPNNTYNFIEAVTDLLDFDYSDDEAPYLVILTSFLDTDTSSNYYSDIYYNRSLDNYFSNFEDIATYLEAEGKITNGAKLIEETAKLDVNSPQFETSLNNLDKIIDQNLSANELKNCFEDASDVLSVLEGISIAADDTASDILHYINNYQAYKSTSDDLLEALKAMQEEVVKSSTYPGKKKSEGTKYATGMNKALTKLIEEIEGVRNGSSCNEIASQFTDTFAANGTKQAAKAFGSTLINSIPAVAMIRASLGGINHISDAFYNGEARNYRAELVKKLDLTACVIDAAANTKAHKLKSATKLKDKFKYATEFDCLIQLYKSTLNQGYFNTKEFIKASIIPKKEVGGTPESIYEDVKTGKKHGGFQDLIVGIEEQLFDINKIQCHDFVFNATSSKTLSKYPTSQSKSFKYYNVACPVTVTVKDNAGNTFATLSDSGVKCPDGYERYFFTYQESDGTYGKALIVPSSYTVELEGTGNGNVTALVNNYENGQNTDTYWFNSVPISSGVKATFEPTQTDSSIVNLKLGSKNYQPEDENGPITSEPEQPSKPDQPEEPEQPSKPEQPDSSDKEGSITIESPDNQESSDDTDDFDTPSVPETPTVPDNPDSPSYPANTLELSISGDKEINIGDEITIDTRVGSNFYGQTMRWMGSLPKGTTLEDYFEVKWDNNNRTLTLKAIKAGFCRLWVEIGDTKSEKLNITIKDPNVPDPETPEESDTPKDPSKDIELTVQGERTINVGEKISIHARVKDSLKNENLKWGVRYTGSTVASDIFGYSWADQGKTIIIEGKRPSKLSMTAHIGDISSDTLTINIKDPNQIESSSEPEVESFTINAMASPNGAGYVSGSGSFEKDESVTLTASPNSGFNFVNWTEDGSIVSTSPTYSFKVSANRTLVANFEKIQTQPSVPSVPDTPSVPESPSVPSQPNTSAPESMPVYRLYNSSSGEHLYTPSPDEVVNLVNSGWTDEGTGWTAPQNGTPVYRLFNPLISDHLYTSDANEVDVLTSQQGWTADFSGSPIFYSANSGLPVYRLYNEVNYRHLLTKDENEYNILPSSGWRQEGISLYGFN